MEETGRKKRVVFYIDGRNWHHSLEKRDLNAWAFNYRRLAEDFTVGPKMPRGYELAAVKYFGARYPSEISVERNNRDDAYFKSLENLGIQVIEGRFLYERDDKGKPKRTKRGFPMNVREKGVDVRLAIELFLDAFYGNVDKAFVLSSDTDLVPAISSVKKERNIEVISMSFKSLPVFTETCDKHVRMKKARVKKYVDERMFKPTQKTLEDLKNKFSN